MKITSWSLNEENKTNSWHNMFQCPKHEGGAIIRGNIISIITKKCFSKIAIVLSCLIMTSSHLICSSKIGGAGHFALQI